jgi:hypothetical protein
VTAPAATERSSALTADREALARIAVTYRVPAYLGAPVEFRGAPGRVVGADPVNERVLVHLDGKPNADLLHPRWGLIWTQENGPATAVPSFPIRPAPALLSWFEDEGGQWSGV